MVRFSLQTKTEELAAQTTDNAQVVNIVSAVPNAAVTALHVVEEVLQYREPVHHYLDVLLILIPSMICVLSAS